MSDPREISAGRTSVTSLPDLLPIPPFTRPARGELVLPGSKSLTNRALLLAALCDQPVTLTGALFSEDTELMAEALRRLGLTVNADATAKTLAISGQAGAFSNTEPVELFVGLAGTAARFLTALCAAAPRGVYRLDGVPQMRKRPMRGLIEALRALGAEVRCTGEEGFFPLEIHARGLSGGAIGLDASESSQLLSALLMVAPLARAPIEVKLQGGVRWTFVEMTFRLMAEFGVGIERDATRGQFTVQPARYRSPGVYPVEPDATAASYFQALPLVTGGELKLPGLRPPGEGLQGDSAFIEVLGRVRARAPGARLEENFHEISDTFLTLAAIAPLLGGPTLLTGLAHTRKQETDRVAGMARELTRLGQEVIEKEDSLEIHPRPLRAGETIETYGDHRFAMSFGILGCHNLHGDGRPWLTIRNPACCAKTFPHFFELLEAIRQKSLAG
ncbi:MAG TPA: 3-phosphoshikimate 1-carboxyvinyltransferase [Opitutus sp.]|nr:3-phosphoshikimate 1-carboxyvinyltransferase [Opitutus sp.]